MNILNIKNYIRLLVGVFSLVLPKKENKLYCNLIGRKVYGGPNRFLQNILGNEEVKNKFEVTNWFVGECRTALVFSASWGKSFSLLCKIAKVKTVLRVDGFYVPEDILDEDFRVEKSLRDWVNCRLRQDIELFDHVIYQSEFSKRICDQKLYKRDRAFSIINNGTNLRHFNVSKQRDTSQLKIVVLGKHYPKHLKLATEVLREVLKFCDAKLCIIGPMRDGKDVVYEEMNRLNLLTGIESSVECLGIVNFGDLPKMLNESQVMLQVKIGDWCPNAIIEALACGLPVVCPSWGGSGELVGDAGVIVETPEWQYDSQTPTKMGEALLQVFKNLDEYSNRARNRAEKKFDINEVAKKYLDVLDF